MSESIKQFVVVNNMEGQYSIWPSDKKIPLGYIAPPEEIARSVVFLASDLARYMTGAVMVADGGLTIDISIPGLAYE